MYRPYKKVMACHDPTNMYETHKISKAQIAAVKILGLFTTTLVFCYNLYGRSYQLFQ